MEEDVLEPGTSTGAGDEVREAGGMAPDMAPGGEQEQGVPTPDEAEAAGGWLEQLAGAAGYPLKAGQRRCS
jgi:hypothetical protein